MEFFYCLALFCLLFHPVISQIELNCENATCPEPLACRYPKVVVELPDPYNKCCNITECICEGSSSRLSASHNPDTQYDFFLRNYENCTMIDGNLEIVSIHPKPEDNRYKLDVTKHIRSVTGYVLIAMSYIHYIDLSSLRLIRGRTLYDDTPTSKQTCAQQPPDETSGYALYIFGNYHANDEESGLREVLMPNLTEIMNGDVKIHENRDLCFVNSIIWDDEILLNTEQKASVKMNENSTCSKCPKSCVHPGVDTEAHCWANKTEFCQHFTRKPCSDKCTQRCNAKGGCCESYCAAGCIVEDRSKGISRECYACKTFNNFGKCEQRCPSGSDSSSTELVSTIDKSKIRYELVWYCVPQCPSTRRIYEPEKRCVLTCPLNFFAENGYCKECPPGGCSNICYGLEAKLGPLKNDDVIHSGNIGNFTKNCTIIEGSLKFREGTFKGDSHCKIPPIMNRTAFDVFENVEEITGFLSIESWPYENLCIFKNLKRIRGYEKHWNAYSLQVTTDTKNLRSLCFNSLQEIETGRVLVWSNPGLCFANTVNWSPMFKEYGQKILVTENAKKNRCLPCDKQCGSDGCWGAKSTQCVTCKFFTDYTNSTGHVADKWVMDPVLKKKFPGHNETNCVKTCDLLKGVYASSDRKCLPCDKECNLTCYGSGPQNCSVQPGASFTHGCKHVHYNGTCVGNCPVTHYPDLLNECKQCSPGCIDGGCEGPEDSYGQNGCSSCYKRYDVDYSYMIYRGSKCRICDDNLHDEECTHGCTFDNTTNIYKCYTLHSNAYLKWLIPVIVMVILTGTILIILWKYLKTTRLMRKHFGEKIVGDGANIDEFDTPLTPSGTAPNRAQLRIVKENELALGKTLGSGAFGAVYKALWTSMHIEGQTIKIPVAVKQLKEFSSSNEIMDEAYVMASVDSPYLIRLLGICMTEQVSLITQLMPLGSLLGYVRDNVDHIGSRHMLTWCTQMAKGMQYLEEKHLVHRDLAARNVLVKTPHHVKITDFGLSKMLNASQSVYLAEGGKLPIKWLAIECINERKFSHQSDVWAFGVTCWEIFTFGAKPYFGVSAVDVLSLLERGERLTQPSVCTIEVYMALIKCWMVEPHCRPRFFELIDEFTKMCLDHTRYLVIKNDSNPGLMSPDPEEERRFFERLIKEDNGDIDGELMIDEPDSYLLHQDEPFHEYTYMSPADSSISESVGQDFPEYENQAAVDQQQGIPTVNGGASTSIGNGGNSRGARLFSRNTPSSRLPTPPTHSHTINPMTGALPRVSDSSNPDDVFANSGHSFRGFGPSKSMTVDLPPPDKGAEARPVRYRPNQAHAWSTSVRKDSEENPRYTEDPTTHNRSSYIEPISSPSTVDHEVLSMNDGNDEQNNMTYDEDDYLLPTPGIPQSNSDYFDPAKPYPKQQSPVETNLKLQEYPAGFRASLSNGTYVESGDTGPLLSTQPPSWPPVSNHQRPQFIDNDAPEYVNSQPEHDYLNWDPKKGDAMMSDILKQNDDFNNEQSRENPVSRTHSGRNPDEVTYFNNEEYMATDSGIGEDNQSVLSASNNMHHPTGAAYVNKPARNRQNSSLSSGGSSNGSLGPLIGGSPLHRGRLSSDEQQLSLDHSAVRYKPVPMPRQSVKKPQRNSPPDSNFGLDNPEYMMLQESVSDVKSILEGESEA